LRSRFRARLPGVIGDLRARASERADDVPPREAGYRILNAAGDEAVIRIYDEIWWLGVNADDFSRDLDNVTAPSIRVEINSPGGDVWDGVAIYNALRNHPAQVTTRIDGMAASIASVIFQAGDRRIVHASSQMMIHNAWGMTVGDHQDHADMVTVLQQQDRVIAGIYAAHGSEDAEHYKALMDVETWMVGDEIVAAGLADEVVEPAASNVTTHKFSDHAETVVADLAEFVNRAEEVVTFRAQQGKPPVADETVEVIARIRGEADRLVALGSPPAPKKGRRPSQRVAAARMAGARTTQKDSPS
jgi:ATP-dependent protease ClpP protease subunit